MKKLCFSTLFWATLMCGTALGQSIQPLSEILLDLGGMTETQARRIAALQAKDQWHMDKGPNYKSTPDHDNNDRNVLSDDVYFEGYWIPDLNISKLAVFSDDGCDVWVNGQLVMNNFKKGQHLPNIPGSFHVVKASPTSNRPYRFRQGQSYHIQIHYSNTIFNGKTDIDGVTLFAMAGGGEPIDLAITDVRGLYMEDGNYEKGYKSADDKGRIYSDRAYDINDPKKHKWARHKNYIDITVEVRPAGTKLPDTARVVWGWEDPDDPSNDNVASDAGPILDPNDYDDKGNPLGNKGNDNSGTRYNAPIWEQVSADYALENNNETKLKDGKSIVRFNVTNHGGDNFVAIPRLRLKPGEEPSKGDKTGIMTMWKYIQLENTRMPDANALPVNRLNAHFKKAFVVWDIESTRRVPNKEEMGRTDRAAGDACDEYVKAPPDGVFRHAGQGGWFFLGSAINYMPTSNATAEKLIDFQTDGMSKITLSDPPFARVAGTIKLPKGVPAGKQVASIVIYRNNRAIESLTLHARLLPGDGRNEIQVTAPNYQIPDDPQSKGFKNLKDHGFANNERIRIDAYTEGALVVAGISPAIFDRGKIYFQGRTIVFKEGGLRTIVHELTHGLGMAHICGNQDYRSVFEKRQSCCMNYGHLWLLDDPGKSLDQRKPKPWTAGDVGLELCAPHIIAIRRAQLADDETAKGRRLGWNR